MATTTYEDELSQMGAASVSLITYEGRPCIRKCGSNEVEVAFYKNFAPQLALQGLRVPKLYTVDDDDLYLEYVPRAVSLEELVGTAETFSQLSIIHQYQPTFSILEKQHQWTTQATEKALSYLDLSNNGQRILRGMQGLGQRLFESKILISGDSNNGNWGRRENGELVLFDWERFGRGDPAIDLAPLVKGMGTLPEYRRVIENYLGQADLQSLDGLGLQRPVTSWISNLILAKAWISVEVVNILTQNANPIRHKYIAWYQQNLEAWLSEMSFVLAKEQEKA